jgi:DNA polymerase III epsilon subunit family exonuclease
MTETSRPADRTLLQFPQLGGTGHELADRPLAVIDVETTGFTPGPDRVVEVAVVRVRPDGTIEDQWETLVHPQRDVGPTWVHHITDAMVDNAPTFGDVAGELLDRLSGAVVVAHNASFDAGFIAHELAHADITVPELPGACTIQLAKWSNLDVANFKLDTCCKALGLTNTGAHTALGDARVTAELASTLLQQRLDLRWDQTPGVVPVIATRAPAKPRGHIAEATQAEGT